MRSEGDADRGLLISELLTRGAPDALAIADPSGCGLTYCELLALVRRTHRTLEDTGLRAQHTVAVCLRNGPETAALFLALASYCRVAPLNPNYTVAELVARLRHLGASAIVATRDAAAAFEAGAQCGAAPIWLSASPGAQPGAYDLTPEFRMEAGGKTSSPGPDEIALLLHTSGTTAGPKLVALSQRQLCLSACRVAETLQLTPADRTLCVMPQFHVHGLVAAVLASVAAGASVCCAPGFNAMSFYPWLDSSRATWYTAVPTIHQAILARASHNALLLARHRLRLIRSASSPLYPPVWNELESVFRVPVINAYGMTEAAHQIASVPLCGGARFRGTVGLPSGPQVAIMDTGGNLLPAGEAGEIMLRGDQVIGGYLRPADANAGAFTDGWFRTGDQGFLDAQGLLTLTGRTKEMINRGGEKISPYEVEEALLLHPGVAQAVAFAVPHSMLGEEVGAAVVIRSGFQVNERELLRYVSLRLSRGRIPRNLLFVEDIPGGPTGKLQRIGLAARLGLTNGA